MPFARAALIGASVADSVLCPLTGFAAWLVWRRIDVALERKRAALRRWGWLLMLSALWPAAIRATESPALALGVLLLCLGAAGATIAGFYRLRRSAALLLLPYTAWLAFMAAQTTTRF